MLSKFVEPGSRIELQAVDRTNEDSQDEAAKRVYVSQVHDILSEDRMEIVMPMDHTRLILLPVDGEYDAVFYTGAALYQCFLRIIDRYKSNNVYILVVELISNLRKFQRREYYRYSCALEMCARPLAEEEVKAVEQNIHQFLTPGLPLKQSVIVDISGGGLRFMSDQKYEAGELIYCTYHLLIGGKNKECEIIGKILSVRESENRKGVFEHRVQYVNLAVDDREEIIKYIFEEERKNRRREKG